jgi:small subunit ribosomal protein S16
MVRIRLRKVGLKNQPSYRIVAADKESPRDGRFLENLGHYNPRTEPATVKVDEARLFHWLNHGAQPSDSVRKILTPIGTWDRWERFKAGEDLETLLEEANASIPDVDPRTRRDDLAVQRRPKKAEKKEKPPAEKEPAAKAEPSETEPAETEPAETELAETEPVSEETPEEESAPTEAVAEATEPEAAEEAEDAEEETEEPAAELEDATSEETPEAGIEEAEEETAEEAPEGAEEETSEEGDEEEEKKD